MGSGSLARDANAISSRQQSRPGATSRQLPAALRSYLQGRLPDYMVPQAFVLMDRLPLTTSGKVDRLALPVPDTARPELQTTFVSPRSPTEQWLTQIWCDVLGLERVGIRDDFFELGGESLSVLKVWNRIDTTFGSRHAVNVIYQYQTIEQMAAYLDRANAPATDSGLSRSMSTPGNADFRIFGMGYGPTLRDTSKMYRFIRWEPLTNDSATSTLARSKKWPRRLSR